jgi:hypothetical protein
MAKQYPFTTALPLSSYHLQYTYKGCIPALEPYYNSRKSLLALYLLSRANLYKVATLVGTSN